MTQQPSSSQDQAGQPAEVRTGQSYIYHGKTAVCVGIKDETAFLITTDQKHVSVNEVEAILALPKIQTTRDGIFQHPNTNTATTKIHALERRLAYAESMLESALTKLKELGL